jgi:predicted alpha/beta hydrolase family esterase
MNCPDRETQVLLLPGYGNSGPTHWQSLWEAENPAFRRVVQDDWMHPVCADWQARLEDAVAQAGAEIVLVAHSLGCLLAAHWSARTNRQIKGALLVAVPDPHGPAFPVDAQGFAPVPRTQLPFPSIVIASTDDPYASIDFARGVAHDWGSEFVDAGAKSHINADSRLGDWNFGRHLLAALTGRSANRVTSSLLHSSH